MPTGGHVINMAALPGFLVWAGVIVLTMALVWLLER
jgi:hypothetical protein